MLSYQHIYHAGNFADVHKHALLVRTLGALKSRHPALCVLDTHAGRGLYDLSSPEALKTGEAANGIGALFSAQGSPLEDYLSLVRAHNPDGALKTYPGSPRLARDMLRPGDRLVLCELHPGEATELEKAFAPAPGRTEILRENGLDALASLLPPPERRGLAVIDPSYEIKSDYAEVPRRVGRALRAWAQGAFFIWYPILANSERHLELLTGLRRTSPGILVSEILLENVPAEGFAMLGSGVALVNPPLPEPAVRALGDDLARVLSARAETFWLDNRRIDPATGFIG